MRLSAHGLYPTGGGSIEEGVYMAAAPIPLHQHAARLLANLLGWAAGPDLEAEEALDIQCGPKILTPDVVVLPFSLVEGPDRVVAARHVRLVAEVESQSSRRNDRFRKHQQYAKAGIPTYLLVDLTQLTVTWYGLALPSRYAIRGYAVGAEPLRLTEPFAVDIVPDDLVRRSAPPAGQVGT
jgi:Uma2 family endonuclease